jgi:uncharacterized linocin/CFP29 family protein
MDHLLRSQAPITAVGWQQITEEAARVLRQRLAGRRLLSFSASGDWTESAVGLGRVEPIGAPTSTESDAGAASQVAVASRRVQAMVELQVDFQVSCAELAAADRGAADMDTSPVIQAAQRAATAEDTLVFVGDSDAGVPGVAAASPHPLVSSDKGLLAAVAEAVELCRDASVAGPYALGVGPELWVELVAGSDRGYPLLSHLQLMLDGPIVWAPSLDGALLVSQRGGDFEIRAGQDWSVGYRSHDREAVHLYLQENFTVLVNTPEAAVRIAGAAASSGVGFA